MTGSLPDQLDALARSLRASAEAWCASGEPPHLSIDGIDRPLKALSYIDLIDDASALEADAAKLRTLYK